MFEFFRRMNSHSLRPMKKHIEKSIPFLIMILFFIIQTTAMGQNDSSSDPDILEKEADELEIKAGKAQDSVTRQRMIFEIRKKERKPPNLETNFTNRNSPKFRKVLRLKSRFY